MKLIKSCITKKSLKVKSLKHIMVHDRDYPGLTKTASQIFLCNGLVVKHYYYKYEQQFSQFSVT